MVNIACADESWFMDFVSDIEESNKSENGDTDEATVLKAIVSCIYKIENGHLLHADTLGIINNGRSERLHMSPQRLGRITRRLGFKGYNQGNLRGIYIDEGLLDRLCQRYGVKKEEAVQII